MATVIGVTATQLTVMGTQTCTGTQSGVLINRLTRSGKFEGAGSLAPTLGDDGQSHFRLTRTDLKSWLSDGFLEGQWVRVCRAGTCLDAKIQNIRGSNAGHDEQMEFRGVGTDALAALVPLSGNFTVTRIAAQWRRSTRANLQRAADRQAGRRRELLPADHPGRA